MAQDRRNERANPAGSTARPNSINVPSAGLDRLFDPLDAKQAGGRARRQFTRIEFRRESIAVQVTHPGGSEVTIRVACRNLSRGGMSVFHSTFLHHGTRVVAHIPKPGGDLYPVQGRIVRCQHVSGILHEIGICFDALIDARALAEPDPFLNRFSLERIAPEELVGRVPLLVPHPADRHMLKHFLRESNIVLMPFDSVAQASTALDGCAAFILSADVPGRSVGENAALLKAAGLSAPLVILLPDASERTRTAARSVTGEVLLVKPLDQELVLRALAEAIIVRKTAKKPPQPAGDEQWMRDALDELVKNTERLASFGDARALGTSALRMKELAAAAGWTDLISAASSVIALAARSAPADALAPALRTLRSEAAGILAAGSGPASNAA